MDCVGAVLRGVIEILMQNGSEQVGNNEREEVSELIGDGDGFDVILACEDAVDSVVCDDTETLMQDKPEQDCEADVAEMLELGESRVGVDVVDIP